MESDKKIFFAAKALLFHQSKFLILHKALRRKDDKVYWELPGGRMEFGESPKETLEREVKEETGLDVEPISILSTWNFVVNDHFQIVGVIYLCKTKIDALNLSSEHDMSKWVDVKEYMKYDLDESFIEEMKEYNWDEILAKLS